MQEEGPRRGDRGRDGGTVHMERVNLLVFGHGTLPQQRIVRQLIRGDVSGSEVVVSQTGVTTYERQLSIDGDPLRVVFSCFSDDLVSDSTREDNFQFLEPLLYDINDSPDGLLFAYSLHSKASRETMTQWSQGLAAVFSKICPGAGPRYMFIGDLTAAGEDAEEQLEGYARMSVRILHEGAQVKFFLTEAGKESELEAAFHNFLKPVLQQKQMEREIKNMTERERLLAEELKQWEAEISGDKLSKSSSPTAATRGIPSTGNMDHRSQTWDEGAVRRRIINRYNGQQIGKGDAGLADIVRLEGDLLRKASPPEKRSWVRCGSPTQTSISPSSSPLASHSTGGFLSERGGPLSRSTSGIGIRVNRIKKDQMEVDDDLRRTRSQDTHLVIEESSSQDDVSFISESDSETGGESELEDKPSTPRLGERRRGGTDDEATSQRSSESEEKISIDHGVREALDSLSLGRFAQAFAKANINFAEFLQLEDDDLKSKLNLPPGARKKIKTFQKKRLQSGSDGATPVMRRIDGEGSPAGLRGNKGSVRTQSTKHEIAAPADSPVKEGSGKRAIMATLKKKFSTINTPSESEGKSVEEGEKRSIFARKPSISVRGPTPSLVRLQGLVKEKGVNHYDEKTAATLLHMECEKEELDKDAVEYLLSNGADPNAVDKDGWTPLHVLCKRKRVVDDESFIRLLISRGAKASLATKEGASPLHYLVRRNPANEDEVKLFCRSLDALLNAGKASVNAFNRHGETPLFHAVMHSNLAVFDALIDRKASYILANKAGATPLHFAVLAQKPDLVQRLLELGVSPDIITDHRMGSPLELARKQTGLKGKIILQLLMNTAENKAGGSFIGGREPPRGAMTKDVSPRGKSNSLYTYSTLKNNDFNKKKRLRATPLRADRWHIDASELTFQHEIGSGSFGTVWKGEWRCRPVAIKKLFITGNNEAQLEAFRQESFVMMSLEPHPNLVQLVGVCNPPDPSIVYEWCPEGDMLSLLKRKKGKLTMVTKLRMALAVAAGMTYLHRQHVLHNDLAARNLLVVKGLEDYDVKVADFGLSTCVLSSTVPQVGPLKWMAPEALHPINPKISAKSDVWSFGVVLWEMLTDGAEPFDDLAPELAAREVLEGKRLSIPSSAPQSLKNLIEMCWSKESDARPTFEDISQQLLDCLERELKSPSVNQSMPAVTAVQPDLRPRRSTPSIQIDFTTVTASTGGDDESHQLKALEAKIPGFVLSPARPRRRGKGGDSDGDLSQEVSPAVSQEIETVDAPRGKYDSDPPGAGDGPAANDTPNDDDDDSDTDSGSDPENDDDVEASEGLEQEENSNDEFDLTADLPYHQRMPSLFSV